MRKADEPEFAPLPRSSTPGVVWPAFPDQRNAATFALLAQLEMTQWWPPDVLLQHQLRQAAELVGYAAKSVPFYRRRLAHLANLSGPMTLADWQTIPLLHRADIQAAGAALTARRPLKGHGDPYDVKTSGSTGEPVVVKWDAVASRFHAGFTMRDHLWSRRDFTGKVAVVRRLSDQVVADLEAGKTARWGAGYPSGPMVFLDVREPVDVVLKWLVDEDPDYLMTYPTFLREMIGLADELGLKPAKLRQVSTFGEVVTDDLRALCKSAWGATVIDTYSTQEVGLIAFECPDHGHYLVQAERVILEVLDDDGRACGPGEIGRVVLTPLHNFAMPLIRYVIGDYAEVGEPCESGRGLPVIKRFLGRAMNMLKLPSGERAWVAVSASGLEKIQPLRQFQIVQTPDLAVRLKMVVERPLSEAEEAEARQAIARATGREFEVHLDYVEAIPRSAGGKLENVMSEAMD